MLHKNSKGVKNMDSLQDLYIEENCLMSWRMKYFGNDKCHSGLGGTGMEEMVSGRRGGY